MNDDEITKRDYFAGLAMQAMIMKNGAPSDYHWGNGYSDKKPEMAEKAYGIADAMIKVGNKT